jgi:hypothetical protein
LKDKVLLNDTWVHPEAKLKAKPRAKAKASPPKVAEATFERSMLSKQMIHMLDGTTMMRLKMSNGSMTQRKKSGRRILLPLLGVYPPRPRVARNPRVEIPRRCIHPPYNSDGWKVLDVPPFLKIFKLQ